MNERNTDTFSPEIQAIRDASIPDAPPFDLCDFKMNNVLDKIQYFVTTGEGVVPPIRLKKVGRGKVVAANEHGISFQREPRGKNLRIEIYISYHEIFKVKWKDCVKYTPFNCIGKYYKTFQGNYADYLKKSAQMILKSQIERAFADCETSRC